MRKLHIIIFLIIAFISVLLCACSTGIESTKTISLSKNDRKALEPTAEEKFMQQISIPVLQQWSPGKSFLVSDDRINLVLDAAYVKPGNEPTAGSILNYRGYESKTNPGGGSELVIVFDSDGRIFKYSTNKTPEVALEKVTSMDIPMLIDLELVNEVKEMLTGKKLWTKSQLWYDSNGNKIEGRKFVPVSVMNVSPGNMVFPLRIDISDPDGNSAMLFMNLRNAGVESRTFPSIFSLSDPKDKYPAIQPEVWNLIQQGKVKIGMTKEECKLSIGNPSDVNSGHDWNNTIDIWSYTNGAFLRFQDGLLIDFRI